MSQHHPSTTSTSAGYLKLGGRGFVNGLLALFMLFAVEPSVAQSPGEPALSPDRNTSKPVRINYFLDECLYVEGYSFDPGASVIRYPCEGSEFDKQWEFRHLGGGWYQVVARHSDLCLAVEDSSLEPGARVIQQACKPTDNDNQLWYVEIEGYFDFPGVQTQYSLRARHSGLCFDDGPDRRLVQAECAVGETVDGVYGTTSRQWINFDREIWDFLPNDSRAFLNRGRFKVTVEWVDFEGAEGVGNVVPFGADDSAMFWFFGRTNWEMLIKVLDGCALNGHYWVFLAAATDVELKVTIWDSETSEIWEHHSGLGRPLNAVTDTAAFATCR